MDRVRIGFLFSKTQCDLYIELTYGDRMYIPNEDYKSGMFIQKGYDWADYE